MLYSLVHSLTATDQVKSLARGWLGLTARRWYRIAYNIWAGISFLPIIWLFVFLPDHPLYAIPMPWVMLTTAGQLIGAAIIGIGILQTGTLDFLGIGQVLSPEKVNENPSLESTGLYSWVRHPLYTGGLLIIWLAPVMTFNLLTIFIVLTIYLFIGARLEEGRMVRVYNDTYRAYQAEVPMILPCRLRPPNWKN